MKKIINFSRAHASFLLFLNHLLYNVEHTSQRSLTYILIKFGQKKKTQI